MMEPIFFPFTHISQSQLKTVLTVFKRISYFPIIPVSEVAGKKKEEDARTGVFPVIQNPERMAAAVRKADEYAQWAALNRGNERNLKTLLKEDPYFKSDTDISTLKSHLLKGVSKQESIKKTADMNEILLQAMVFLRISQVLDGERETIREQFESLKRSENRLMDTIKGSLLEEDILQEDPHGHEDQERDEPGEYLTAKRIHAWFTFFKQNGYVKLFNTKPILVTTSEAVFEYIVSFDKKSVNALDIDNIKVHENNCVRKNSWQTSFYTFVQSALENKAGQIDRITGSEDGCAVNARIRLYLLSGENAENNILQNTYETVPVCLVQLNKKNT